MDVESIREYAISKPDVTEGFPFGGDTLVFKVNNKIFLLLSLTSHPLQFNAKCDPEEAERLREEYPGEIIPGYHMNKKHWNTVITGGSVPGKLLQELISNSYDLVAGKKKKK